MWKIKIIIINAKPITIVFLFMFISENAPKHILAINTHIVEILFLNTVLQIHNDAGFIKKRLIIIIGNIQNVQIIHNLAIVIIIKVLFWFTENSHQAGINDIKNNFWNRSIFNFSYFELWFFCIFIGIKHHIYKKIPTAIVTLINNIHINWLIFSHLCICLIER